MSKLSLITRAQSIVHVFFLVYRFFCVACLPYWRINVLITQKTITGWRQSTRQKFPWFFRAINVLFQPKVIVIMIIRVSSPIGVQLQMFLKHFCTPQTTCGDTILFVTIFPQGCAEFPTVFRIQIIPQYSKFVATLYQVTRNTVSSWKNKMLSSVLIFYKKKQPASYKYRCFSNKLPSSC